MWPVEELNQDTIPVYVLIFSTASQEITFDTKIKTIRSQFGIFNVCTL